MAFTGREHTGIKEVQEENNKRKGERR